MNKGNVGQAGSLARNLRLLRDTSREQRGSLSARPLFVPGANFPIQRSAYTHPPNLMGIRVAIVVSATSFLLGKQIILRR